MKAVVIESPYETYGLKNLKKPSIFLGGGITNCPDWQSDVIRKLKNKKIVIYNPRRENFPVEDDHESMAQIIWEHKHLAKSDIICFWFCKETINPIVLYELGRWGNSSKRKIVIGMDLDYERKSDVIIQTKLSRPKIVVHENFNDFIKNIEKLIKVKRK